MDYHRATFGPLVPGGIQLPLTLLGAILVYGAFQSNFLFLIPLGILLAYGTWTAAKGQVTDLVGWRTKRYYSIWPFRFGVWKPIGRPDLVLLSHDLMRSSVVAGPWGVLSTSTKDVFYDVDLTEDDSKFVTVLRTFNREDAEALAQKLANDLALPLKDIRD